MAAFDSDLDLVLSEHRPAIRALHQTFYDLWQFGGNALVGWLPTLNGIEVLTMPKIRLFNTASVPARTFAGKRRMGPRTFAEIAEAFGIQAVELRLDQPIGDGPGQLPLTLVEAVFSRFAVSKTSHRAVMLIDIVGFTKYTAEQQASQLASLEFALNIAGEATREQGIEIDLARLTTGDGFYVWNRAKGTEPDLALFVAFVMFMTYHALLARQVRMPGAVSTLRAAIGVGSAYGHHQPNRDGTRDIEYIGGAINITLARLLQRTAANQIIVGDFQRPDDETGRLLPSDDFVRRASERLAGIKGLDILGYPVERFAFYLTGPRRDDGSYGIQKLRVVDKHGFEHFGYNAKINTFLGSGESFYCGLQQAELVRAAG